ncbi:MAG TPA: DUF5703 domain-containing protein, partial [Burkholderiales bacterium]|nr:DUF5703 domain-containing protein [Burkholderiales bacterium]
MKRTLSSIVFFFLIVPLLVAGTSAATGAGVAGGAAGGGPAVDRYDVVWDSPSADHHGSMPLGNGDIALNAWMTAAGDLQFYIAKTDAWDDSGRLVKVGKVRLRFEPNPVVPGMTFRQTLRLSQGAIEIQAGRPDSPDGFSARLWVDANDPVIHISAQSAQPREVTAFVELWRTARREVTDMQVSDIFMNRKR